MKRTFLAVILTIMLLPASLYSQEHSITLESVSNTIHDTLMIAGNEHVFQLRVRNLNDYWIYGTTNGFRIFSNDGATWGSLSGITINNFVAHYTQFFVSPFNPTGSDADTIGFGGITFMCPSGIQPFHDEISFEIKIGPTNITDHGKTICIDSTWYPAGNPWLWGSCVNDVFPPDWSGQRCWTVVACDTLNLPDSDLDGIADICDQCPGFDDKNDFDHDGIPDDCDECTFDALNDIDNDGICGSFDNCPSIFNPQQIDSDHNGIGDACTSIIGPHSITLQSVSNSYNDTLLIAGNIHLLEFKISNFDTLTYNFTNGIRVYSLHGATWDNTSGSWLNNFDLAFNSTWINPFSVTGSGADTLGFAGASIMLGQGIPTNYNNKAFQITIGPTNLADHGKKICIDSSWFRSSNPWKWSSIVGVQTVFPNWSGHRCWTVYDLNQGCCFGMTGNVDFDPNDEVDIGDLTYLLRFLFRGTAPPVCMDEANMDGVGVVDIGDLTRLIDFLFISLTPLAPCQ